MFRHLMDQPPLEESEGPMAVLMSPTRELALQTYNEARKFAKVLDMRVACIYGGSNISDQVHTCTCPRARVGLKLSPLPPIPNLFFGS